MREVYRKIYIQTNTNFIDQGSLTTLNETRTCTRMIYGLHQSEVVFASACQ